MWARGAEEALDGRMMADDVALHPKDAIKKWCVFVCVSVWVSVSVSVSVSVWLWLWLWLWLCLCSICVHCCYVRSVVCAVCLAVFCLAVGECVGFFAKLSLK